MLPVSVGDLGQEGRRRLELCFYCGETVLVARENHMGEEERTSCVLLCSLLIKGS